MLIIFICNALIIVKTMKDDNRRKSLRFVSTRKSPITVRKKRNNNHHNSFIITSSNNSGQTAAAANNKTSPQKVIQSN